MKYSRASCKFRRGNSQIGIRQMPSAIISGTNTSGIGNPLDGEVSLDHYARDGVRQLWNSAPPMWRLCNSFAEIHHPGRQCRHRGHDGRAPTEEESEELKAMRLHRQSGWKAEGMLGVLCIAIALLWSSASKAETRVYLLRGWFGVFSTGLDSLAAELKSKGIKAETVGHLAWRTTVSNIIKDHASGKSAPLVLVGHSQGANNVIDMARLLQRENIPVDLLVTLAPAMQDPIPGNVVRAINYYNSPGWGAPVTADAGYHGKLTNINLGGDIGIYHMAIDKNPKIQVEIERAILAVAQAEAQAR